MLTKLSGLMGATVAVILVIVALWGWRSAGGLVEGAERPELAVWAVRSGSIAALAAAQALGLTLVAGMFFRRDRAGEWLSVAAGLVSTVALISALTLGMVSK